MRPSAQRAWLLVLMAAVILSGASCASPKNDPAGAASTETPLLATAVSSTAAPSPLPAGGEAVIPNGQMVLVPAGPFTMGCDPQHNDGDDCLPYTFAEPALRQVTLDAYQIDIYEVTNANYLACMALGGCNPPPAVASATRPDYFINTAYGNYPVLNLTWGQAASYCAWIGKRLPSEAEWIKAGRGASDTRPYPWGEASPDCSLANTRDCVGDTAPAGSLPAGASPYGVLDLVGNAREWVADWWRGENNSFAPDRDPLGPAEGIYKMFMGSDWDSPYSLQLVNRENPAPLFSGADRQVSIGFRCAAAADYPQGVSLNITSATTPLPPVDQPAEGKASLAGRVLWNSQPVAGVESLICADFDRISSCTGEVFTATTDLEGWYVYEDLPPDSYYVFVHALDPQPNQWFHFFDKSVSGAAQLLTQPLAFPLTAGQVTILEDMLVYKTDLQITSPPDEAYLHETPTLSWSAYPGAAYYGVSFSRGSRPSIAEKVVGTEFPITRELRNCAYSWEVSAYDSQGNKIAETPERSRSFNLVGQTSSCWLEIYTPSDGAVFRAGEPIEFSWRADPSAVDYDIYVHVAEGGETVANAGDLQETRFSLPEGLPAGDYTWSVNAFIDLGLLDSGSVHLRVIPNSQLLPELPVAASLPAEPPMALIPAGSFQMGSDAEEDEQPVHTVTLDAYRIDVYEVTNAYYAACVSAGWCLPPRSRYNPKLTSAAFANLPVTNLTWYAAQTYCAWRGMRLPSEAEWEKAARGGLEGKLYPWGDDEPVCTPGAFNGTIFSECEPYGLAAVGSFAPNGYGLYDMTGNASEWVNDWYLPDYYSLSPEGNPPGPENGIAKVVRGGGQYSTIYDGDLTISSRGNPYGSKPSLPGMDTGFRCAVTP
jgi:formylglycine-generating enzyme required for sulfatase activity